MIAVLGKAEVSPMWGLFWLVLLVAGGLGVYFLGRAAIAIILWTGGSLLALLGGLSIIDILAFGTGWFWLLVAAACILVFYSIDDIAEDDIPVLAPFVIFGAFLLLQIFGNVKVFSYIGRHPVWSLVWGGCYVGLGVLYATCRWTHLGYLRSRNFIKAKAEFFEMNHVTGNTITPELAERWGYLILDYGAKPLIRHHKTRYTGWMMYWPWDLPWWLLSDLIKDLYQNIYELMHDAVQGITNWQWRNVEAEIGAVQVQQREDGDSSDRR